MTHWHQGAATGAAAATCGDTLPTEAASTSTVSGLMSFREMFIFSTSLGVPEIA
jgi:hypothetical protein